MLDVAKDNPRIRAAHMHIGRLKLEMIAPETGRLCVGD